MNINRNERTLQIVDETKFAKVANIKLIVFGVGGVGGQAVEGLVRAGFLNFTLVDRDVVEGSNLNRQIIATSKTLGQRKVEAAKARMLEINPKCTINMLFAEVSPENIESFELESFDYIIDSIDSIISKIALIKYALKRELPIISAMGTGNRLDPTKVIICDISNTKGCPLARKIRYELRKENLSGLTVVSSSELPLENSGKKPGSSPFVPAAAGLAIASYIFTNVIRK